MHGVCEELENQEYSADTERHNQCNKNASQIFIEGIKKIEYLDFYKQSRLKPKMIAIRQSNRVIEQASKILSNKIRELDKGKKVARMKQNASRSLREQAADSATSFKEKHLQIIK